ncbi:integrase catalytic domain-containing protein [Trichonephila clavipes]|nr:integrase catalytic domain-containing protein [Trichonephila clavipes]
MFLQDIRDVGVPELDQIDENKLNKRLLYQNRIQNDLRKRFRVEYLSQLRETRNIKGENTLSEGDIVLVGDDHTKRLNWNLGKILKLYPGKDKKVRVAQVKTKFGSFLRPVQKLYLLEVTEKNKSSVHPTNSPLFSDANEGSHLPINIDHELSKPERAATSSMQSCSSISNGGAGLEPRAETSGHQQAETSSMQPFSSVSDGEAGVEPRLETLELPDILTSDGELQQPGPRRSFYEFSRKNKRDNCDLKALLEFFGEEIQSRQRTQSFHPSVREKQNSNNSKQECNSFAFGSRSNNRNAYVKQKGNNSSAAELLVNQSTANSKCIFCGENLHDSSSCDSSETLAAESLYGWCLIGLSGHPNKNSSDFFAMKVVVEVGISKQLETFWQLENLGIEPVKENLNCNDDKILQEFEENIQFRDGRYVVQLPWKDNLKELVDNNYEIFSKIGS